MENPEKIPYKMDDRPLMDIEEYYKKFGRRSNKCGECGKYYKLPTYIFRPRDKICFTCEVSGLAVDALSRAVMRTTQTTNTGGT